MSTLALVEAVTSLGPLRAGVIDTRKRVPLKESGALYRPFPTGTRFFYARFIDLEAIRSAPVPRKSLTMTWSI